MTCIRQWPRAQPSKPLSDPLASTTPILRNVPAAVSQLTRCHLDDTKCTYNFVAAFVSDVIYGPRTSAKCAGTAQPCKIAGNNACHRQACPSYSFDCPDSCGLDTTRTCTSGSRAYRSRGQGRGQQVHKGYPMMQHTH